MKAPGEMFQVTTMDLKNIPTTQDGAVDFSEDFFGKPTNLTVSGQLNGETYAMPSAIFTPLAPLSGRELHTTRHALSSG